MNQKGNDCFRTPPSLFKQLNDIFNFTLDVACDSKNCLCEKGCYFDKFLSGLDTTWGKNRCFCNPPFSNKAMWIEKAYKEVVENVCPVVVMILPLNSMDSKAWHKYIEGKMHYEIIEGRVSFIDPKTGKPKSGNNSGTVIVYFKKKIKR